MLMKNLLTKGSVTNLGSICADRLKNWLISPCGFLAMTAQLPESRSLAGANLSSKFSSSTLTHFTRGSSVMGTPSLYLENEEM